MGWRATAHIGGQGRLHDKGDIEAMAQEGRELSMHIPGKHAGRGSRQCEAPDGGMGVCPEQMNEREKGGGEAERHGMGEAQNPVGLVAHLAFARGAPRSHCRVLTQGRTGSASCFKSTFPAALRRTYCKGGPKQETGQRGFSTI